MAIKINKMKDIFFCSHFIYLNAYAFYICGLCVLKVSTKSILNSLPKNSNDATSKQQTNSDDKILFLG